MEDGREEVRSSATEPQNDQVAPSATASAKSAENTSSAPPPVITPSQHRRIFKIIVIGDSNVGKTCLTYRFCGGKFLDRSEATIGVDFREKTVQIDDELIKLQIWDTAGQERFRKSMISHYYRNVHAVIFVYDVTNFSTFENLSTWIEEYNRHCRGSDAVNHVPKILVGNKCDLESDAKVSTSVAQSFADTHDMPLFETSAKDDTRQDHVEAIFMTLALKLKNSKPFFVPNVSNKARIQPAAENRNNQTNESESSCFCLV